LRRLIGGQQGEKPFSGRLFPFGLCLIGANVVAKVSRQDFYLSWIAAI
jgi:hypothetical protein